MISPNLSRLAICVGAVLVAAPLVRVLYGPDFTESIPVFALLALCVPPMYLNIMANQLMIARNQQMVWTKMMALASLINPALNLVLIPYFQRTQGNGAIGASIAMVVTELVLAVIGYVLVRDTFTRNSVVRLLRAAVATALMAGLVILALRAGLVAGIVTGMITFPLRAPGGAHRHREAPALGSRGHHRPPTPPATERQQKLSRVSRLRCAPAPAADRCSVESPRRWRSGNSLALLEQRRRAAPDRSVGGGAEGCATTPCRRDRGR